MCASYVEFAKLASIKEAEGVPRAEKMIRLMIDGQEAVVRTARSVFPIAEPGE
jgi:starvation-inducible DNA-binding protein